MSVRALETVAKADDGRPVGNPRSARVRRSAGLVLPWLAALAALVAWSLASPAGSSPDDNFHLPSIWCAAGTDDVRCLPIEGNDEARVVPDEVAGAPCFAFKADVSGQCQAPFGKTTGPNVGTDFGNWNGLYPPGFHRVMHVFVGDSVASSVLRMRLANSVLLLVMLASLTYLLPRRLRIIPAMTVLLTAVPLGLSIYASSNPSSWALISAATVWVSFHAALQVEGRRRLGLVALGLVGAVLGASARSDQALFTVLAIGVVLLARLPWFIGDPGQRWERIRASGVVLLGAGLAALISAWGFLAGDQSSAVSGGLATSAGGSWWDLTRHNALGLPTVWFGALGYGDQGTIGWLDTRFPAVVGFGALFAWVAVMFGQWRGISRARGAAMGVLLLAMAVYPLYLLAVSGATIGTQFQPRYVLPLLIVFTGFSLLGRKRWLHHGPWQRWALVVALSIAQSFALFTQIRRYTTGTDVPGFNLNKDTEWWWPVGGLLSPNGVWLIGSVAFAGLVWWMLGRRTAFGVQRASGK
ncbi:MULTISPECIES: DUF2142 domain-containing protein [unclassified Nocardioides]|uniref:DUF2142 domain-containing protein n=1 Tax=unclassified Nocardioides TaxID=2615069 RepID=UPI00360DD0E7